MKILVIGAGGREHALVWKLGQSKQVTAIYAAPGNAGTSHLAQNLDVPVTDIPQLLRISREKRIDMVVVGPEGPLAEGIVDRFQASGIPIFGPTQQAARIESSKIFAKDLMQQYHIPCAKSAAFTEYNAAKNYLAAQPLPIVIKADGLAAGKGVVVAQSKYEALSALAEFMQKKSLGTAGYRVIIEEYLAGREVSTFVFTDGQTVVPMVPACDYKRVFDGDLGNNTGGMGSYSPPSFYTPIIADIIQKTIMVPTTIALAAEGIPYKGVLYGGLMVKDNQPKVLEYNARFGDPETEVVLPRLKTDLVEIMLAVIENHLNKVNIEWSEDACVGVVLASGGYPGAYQTGFPIMGLDKLPKEIIVFHAGTRLDSDGHVVTNGGRVLVVVATAKTVAAAREIVYQSIPLLQFDGCHYRRDIALIEER